MGRLERKLPERARRLGKLRQRRRRERLHSHAPANLPHPPVPPRRVDQILAVLVEHHAHRGQPPVRYDVLAHLLDEIVHLVRER